MEQAVRINLFSENRSKLHLDPRTKIFVLLGMCLVFTLNPYNAFGYIMRAAMLVVTAASLAGAGARRTAIGIAVLVLGAFALQEFGEAVLYGIFGSTSVFVSVLRFFCVVLTQFIPQTMYAYSIVLSTKVSEFIAAMKRMHLPDAITIPFAVVFRFFPTVGEEYRSIRDAMKLRGLDWRCGPVAMIEYRLVPLIISLVKIGDELAAACATRGLGVDKERSHVQPIGFRAFDVAMILFVGMCAVATIYMRLNGASW